MSSFIESTDRNYHRIVSCTLWHTLYQTFLIGTGLWKVRMDGPDLHIARTAILFLTASVFSSPQSMCCGLVSGQNPDPDEIRIADEF